MQLLSNKCLITCHGFSEFSSEMSPIGEYFEKKGYRIHNLKLPGHDTTPEDLKNTKWKEWTSYANNEIDYCLESYQNTFFCGFSLGGVMTLFALQNHHKLKGGATLAAPTRLLNFYQSILIKVPYIGFWIKQKEMDLTNEKNKNIDYQVYNRFHTNSVKQLNLFITYTRKNLKKIVAPLIIIHSKKDKIIDPKCADEIYKNISSSNKKKVILDDSNHLLLRYHGNQELFLNIYNFFENIMKT